MRLLLTIALVSLSLAAPALAQLNNCASAYWANTMRCKAFPAQPPQANFGTVPTAADRAVHARVSQRRSSRPLR